MIVWKIAVKDNNFIGYRAEDELYKLELPDTDIRKHDSIVLKDYNFTITITPNGGK